MKRVVFKEGLDIPVSIESNKSGYLVKYGCVVREKLTYAEACTILGECVMHSAVCAGTLEGTE